jgi:hypothetical protein
VFTRAPSRKCPRSRSDGIAQHNKARYYEKGDPPDLLFVLAAANENVDFPRLSDRFCHSRRAILERRSEALHSEKKTEEQ